MKNPPVHWYEGLFLSPHHLQAWDRHLSERDHISHQWDHPFNYGLRSIELSHEALANYQVEINKLQVRMRDGTLIDLDVGQAPDRLDLKTAVEEANSIVASLENALEKEAVVRVYVGIPRLKLGRPNVAGGHSNGSEVSEDVRFENRQMALYDENRSSGEQDIAVRELNIRILLSSQDLSGYELLPIAQIKRAGDGNPAPQMDDSYIPPVVALDAWPKLGRGIVREIYDIIGQKIEVLSQQILNRGIGRDSRDPGASDRFAMLEVLNQAYATFTVLGFSPGVHPLTAYTELCRVIGQLSIFSDERRTTDIPAYDHEDLARIFRFAYDRIAQIIHSVRDYEFQQRFFVGVGMGMQVSLEPRWFNSDWQWFIGVRKGDLSDHECREILSEGHLDWKLGSSRQVEILFKRRAEGLQLRPLDRQIPALPSRQDWVFYEVLQTDTPAWRDVYETQTLAMRLKDSLILNLDRLQGEQELVVSTLGKKISLQFALFAVPTHV